MFKRFISLMLVIVLIVSLTACGKSKTSTAVNVDSQEPYYSETVSDAVKELTFVQGIKLDSQGNLVVFDSGKNRREASEGAGKAKFATINAKGEKISEFECKPGIESNEDFDGGSFALDAQDNIYQLVTVHHKEVSEEAISSEKKWVDVYDKTGKKLRTIELDGEAASSAKARIMMMKGSTVDVDASGNIFIHESGKYISMYDKEGKLVRKLGGSDCIFAALDEDGNVIAAVMGSSGFMLQKIDSTTGDAIWKQKSDSGRIPMSMFYNKQDKGIYLADEEGIVRYDGDGKSAAKVMDLADSSIIPSENYVMAMAMDSKQDIYLLAMVMAKGDKPYKLLKFEKQKAGSRKADTRKVLTVSTARQSMLLETMARKFEEQHPEVKVEIRSTEKAGFIMQKGDADIEKDMYEKYVQTVNTEIMSGKAADIISLEGLPYKKYVEKGIFEDVGKYIAGDKGFDTGNFFSNIIEACKYKGKLYGLPTAFSFGAIGVDAAALDKSTKLTNAGAWTWEQFIAAARASSKDVNGDGRNDVFALSKMEKNRLFEMMFSNNMAKFIDVDNKKASFESPEFIQLLEYVKELTDDKHMNPTLDEDGMMQNGSRGSVAFRPMENVNAMDFSLIKALMGEEATIVGMPSAAGENKNAFKATMYGINSNSAMKDTAWEFLKFLVTYKSEGGMIMAGDAGLSVNKDSVSAMFKTMMNSDNKMKLGVATKNGTMKTIEAKPLTEDQVKSIMDMIARLGQLDEYSGQIKSIIEGELEAYFNNQRSAEAVAKIIQNKINTYLNE